MSDHKLSVNPAQEAVGVLDFESKRPGVLQKSGVFKSVFSPASVNSRDMRRER